MGNQLRLLTDPGEADGAEAHTGSAARDRDATARPRRRRGQGPSSAAAGRIDTRTRRAGREGVAEARRALLAATSAAELRRAG